MLNINKMTKNAQFFTELIPEEEAIISGGEQINVPTTDVIENGRARIRVDLRPGLKDKSFDGNFESCDAYFDDFTGELSITCVLSSEDINGGVVLFRTQ